MDIIKELKEIRWLILQVQKDQARLDALRGEIGISTSKWRESASRGSTVPDIMAEMIVKVDEITTMRLRRRVEIEARILEVENVVNALPREQRMVLRLRYFEGYSWRLVAKTMHYTREWCNHFHAEAIKSLQK